MRICHISTVHTPFDGRIFHKECKSLSKAGYDVYLVVPHDRDEVVEGIKVKAIRKYSNPYARIIFAPILALQKALATKARVYHLHDPELLIIGFILSLLGKKVIFDSHEYVGKQILSKEWIPTRILRRFVSHAYNLIEYLLTLTYYGVITADTSAKKQFSHKKRCLTLLNYPILGYISQQKYKEILKNGNKIVIYLGGLTRIRGIKELIMAMLEVDAKLWLMGPWESEAFREECELLDGWEKSTYLGIMPFGEQYDYVRAADIGMATLYPEENYLESLPVKAFEYMACGAIPIMSDFDYWKEFYGGYALFIDPFRPEDIAEKINLLLNNEALMEKMKQVNLDKVNADFSWEEESKKLIDFYPPI